jgi:hypothetical protein
MLYTTAIANVDKKVKTLDKKVKAQGLNSRSVTSDEYAEVMTGLLKDIQSLLDTGDGGVQLAFNLLLHLGHHS